jgi:hypothetical protein
MKYHSKTPLNNEYTLKNERQVLEQVLFGGEWRMKEGEYGQGTLYTYIKREK